MEDLIKKMKKIASTQLIKKIADSKFTADEEQAARKVLDGRGVILPKDIKGRVLRTNRKIEWPAEVLEMKAKLKQHVGRHVKFQPHRQKFDIEGHIINVGIDPRNNTFFYFIRISDNQFEKSVYAKRIDKVVFLDA